MFHYPDKYDLLIDAQTWRFIERTNAWYPADTVDQSIGRQREIYDAMCREFFNGYPDGIEVCDGVTGGTNPVAIRQYMNSRREAHAQIVYLHGGGFVAGGLESHDDVCAELCKRTGFAVISVDYRLAPEHLHPAAFDDAFSGFRHVIETNDLPVIMAGDSAGGNLAAAVCHAARNQAKRIIGQVLIYPALGGDMNKGSYVEHEFAPMLTLKEIRFYLEIRTNGIDVSGDVTYAPLCDNSFERIPPTVVVSAQCDPLSDDGRDYCNALTASGGKAHWINETGLVHGFLRARHSVKRAENSFSRIVEAISALGRSKWPYPAK